MQKTKTNEKCQVILQFLFYFNEPTTKIQSLFKCSNDMNTTTINKVMKQKSILTELGEYVLLFVLLFLRG